MTDRRENRELEGHVSIPGTGGGKREGEGKGGPAAAAAEAASAATIWSANKYLTENPRFGIQDTEGR